jgi:methanol--5-hydroxybenzimidazolylcobamide Co-methyltransferase
MTRFSSLAINNPDDLIFGKAPRPLATRRGMVIGGGTVYPELKFTLPPMEVSDAHFAEVKTMYKDIVQDACKRAVELDADGVVIEFETLIEMTLNPRFAIEITAQINDILENFHAHHGLKSVLRVTPNDTRDKNRPPQMRSGKLIDDMFLTFEKCAENGGELLSIESTGGKEINDDALLSCDIEKVIFALSIMGVRDMEFLWKRIVDIAHRTHSIAAGDTACGFGNTAMVLADRHFIPRIFAAIVRVISVVRSLVAYEQGAVGPGKDCGYENAYLKAITGFPMSMEGKTAACAHLSPVGNIASATCDLWSNEAIQNIKLLSGMGPTVSMEQLIYDCRLMNRSRAEGGDLQLRNWLVRSDQYRDPQAFVLAPEVIIPVSQAIVSEACPYCAAKAGALVALDLISRAYQDGLLKIAEMEVAWIDMLGSAISSLPNNPSQFIDQVMPTLEESKYRKQDYLLQESASAGSCAKQQDWSRIALATLGTTPTVQQEPELATGVA